MEHFVGLPCSNRPPFSPRSRAAVSCSSRMTRPTLVDRM
ncbi:hypothetical protein ACFU6I_48285 [Streptomyces sp. NPDC057486]